MQLQLLNFPALVSLGAAAAQKACKKLSEPHHRLGDALGH
jgi:hypothetical protein